MEINIIQSQKNEKEILEMILQFCYENKFIETAKLLEAKTNIIYDQNEIQELKYLLKEHEFERSIQFLEKSNFENLQKAEVLKIIKSRKLIELIKNAKQEQALEYIRRELSPLIKNINILNKFSSMLFIKDKENLERFLRQNFIDVSIDESLILKVQNLLCLSLDSNGNRILPNSRLENLLNSYYNMIESDEILKDYNDKNDRDYDVEMNQEEFINDKSNESENEIDIEMMIDKNIEEIGEIFQKKNYNKLNDLVTDDEKLKRKRKFIFEQIFSLEKNEDEIWHMEFSKSNTYFAICSRNGIISIFKIYVNEIGKRDKEFSNNINNKKLNNTQKEKEKDFDTIFNEGSVGFFDSKSSIETKSLSIECLNSFLSHKKSVTSISWSKNEKYLITSSINKEIILWNPFDGNMIKKFNHHTDIVTSVKWISDELFVSGSIDKKMRVESIDKGLVCCETFSRIRKILLSEFYNCIIIVPASMNDIIFYDYKNYREINRLIEMDPIISANISKNDEGRHIIVNLSKVNASINLYEISNLKLINKFYGHSQEQYSIECSFAGEDDEFIICGSEDACIYIWHISDSIPIRIMKGHTGTINFCSMVKIYDKNFIFSASDDHTVRIWGDKAVEIKYEDKSVLKKKINKIRVMTNQNSGSSNNINSNNNPIFDVINTSNWGMHNNDISLNDESRDESSDYYVEEDD